MIIIKRIGWIVVAVVIAVIGMSRLFPIEGQTLPPKPDASRLTIAYATTPIGMFAFVKDTKTEGCWIVLTKSEGVGMAAAPISACQQANARK